MKWLIKFWLFVFTNMMVIHGSNAAVITVDANAADDNGSNGNCSLIDAIRSANNDSSVDQCTSGNGADTIILPPNGIYNLQAVVNTQGGANGTPCVTSDITIDGGNSTITKNESLLFRLFCVLNTGTLSLNQLTLSNGLASGTSLTESRGGAIMAFGKIALDEVTFNNNDARVQGGAVFIRGEANSTEERASIENSTFTNNSAPRGGAIRVDELAVVSISTSAFSGNTAEFGGGLFINDSNATITESSFNNNTSVTQGGAVTFSNANVTVSRSRFTNNSTGDKGGALRIDNESDVSILESVIDGNSTGTGTGGGGIYLILSTLDIIQTTISNNIGDRGAGINVDVAVAQMENVTFSGNVADKLGGGIYIDAEETGAPDNSIATLTNVTIVDNDAKDEDNDGPDRLGGGLWVNPRGNATLRNTVIALNRGARECGGLGPGAIVNGGGNWFGDASCGGASQGNPFIGQITDNGGFSETHGPLPDSPLVDAGIPGPCPSEDQRGEPRNDGLCDIGAFEGTSTNAPPLEPPVDVDPPVDPPVEPPVPPSTTDASSSITPIYDVLLNDDEDE